MDPDILRHLFEMEVPEIQEHIIEIKDLARDPGYRSKIAVSSRDSKVDCVGACVGIRGSRIKQIVEELNGEKIDIVRWNDSIEVLIMNAMKPAEIQGIILDYDEEKALVFVDEDQLSLAIGKRGQNVRLASKLAGWAIDVFTGTPDNYEEKFVTSRDIFQERAEAAAQAEAEAAAQAEAEAEAEAEAGELESGEDLEMRDSDVEPGAIEAEALAGEPGLASGQMAELEAGTADEETVRESESAGDPGQKEG